MNFCEYDVSVPFYVFILFHSPFKSDSKDAPVKDFSRKPLRKVMNNVSVLLSGVQKELLSLFRVNKTCRMTEVYYKCRKLRMFLVISFCGNMEWSQTTRG